jgi:hypothetical protein
MMMRKLIVICLIVMLTTTTKSSPLEILRNTTKPKSKEEMTEFLIRKHGGNYASRSNASSDESALDANALTALQALQAK